jgi:excisionase family DNA binding protein
MTARGHFVLESPMLLVPPQMAGALAALIDRGLNGSGIDVRALRRRDPDLVELIEAIERLAAMHRSSASSQNGTPETERVASLPSMMTANDAAIRLRLTPRGVHKLRARGGLPAERTGGRWLFHADDVDRVAHDRKVSNIGA